ncbi:unnamed protein product, partial [Chrysoparadoxa australica]
RFALQIQLTCLPKATPQCFPGTYVTQWPLRLLCGRCRSCAPSVKGDLGSQERGREREVGFVPQIRHTCLADEAPRQVRGETPRLAAWSEFHPCQNHNHKRSSAAALLCLPSERCMLANL